MFDDAKYDEVVAHVKELANAGGAVEVRDHFAGYFNELGLWVAFAERASDREIVALGNRLLAYLNEVLPRDNTYFPWLLSLDRGRTTVDVLAPGDTERDLNASLSVLK